MRRVIMEDSKDENATKCVYCNTRPATTREHVIARCFFDKQPDYHIVVPTCPECNGGTGDGVDRPMSMDEEYVRTVLCLHAGSHGHPVADAIVWGKIARSFKRTPDGLRKSLVDVSHPAMLQHKGILIPNQNVIDVDIGRVVRVLRKITKGLYYRHNNVPLPAECDVWVQPSLPPDEFYQWLAMFKLCSYVGPFVAGEGVFTYMGIRQPEEHSTTVWLATFYNRFTCMMVTARNTVRSVNFAEPGKPEPIMVTELKRGTAKNMAN